MGTQSTERIAEITVDDDDQFVIAIHGGDTTGRLADAVDPSELSAGFPVRLSGAQCTLPDRAALEQLRDSINAVLGSELDTEFLAHQIASGTVEGIKKIAAELDFTSAQRHTANVLGEAGAMRDQRHKFISIADDDSASHETWLALHREAIRRFDERVSAGDTTAARKELIASIAAKAAHVEAIDRQLEQS